MSFKNSGTYRLGKVKGESAAPRRIRTECGIGIGDHTQELARADLTYEDEDLTCERVDVEIITDAIQARREAATPVRSPSQGTRPSSQKTRTWAVPVPPSAGASAPQPARKPTPGRNVNLTRIFELLPSASALPEAKPSDEPRPTSDAGRAFSPVPNTKRLARPTPKPNGEASKLAQPVAAPLLRAFDDAVPHAATWSTAQTVAHPVFQVEQPKGGATAPISPAKHGAPRSWRLPSAREIVGNLRQSSPAIRNVSGLVLAVATVAGLGMLAAWSIARMVVPGSVTAPPPVSRPIEPHVAAPATVATRAAPASSAPIQSSPPAVEATASESPTRHAPVSKAVPNKPPSAADTGGSSQVTLARQAVDALIAGDRAKALLHYRELSRVAPDHKAYSEAVRLLTPSASSKTTDPSNPTVSP